MSGSPGIRTARLGGGATALLALCLACVCGWAMEARSAEPRVLYLSPVGDDANDGTIAFPLRTLQRAQEILLADPPHGEVSIRLRSDEGEYHNDSVVWRYYDPRFPTVFEPYPADRPAVFRADALEPPSQPFFTLEASRGERTNIVIRGLRIEDYVGWVFRFAGDRENPSGGWNGGNVIEDCTIRNIGNARMPSRPIVYGAIQFVNSIDNTIRGCRFSSFSNANTFVEAAQGAEFPDAALDADIDRSSTGAATSILPIIAVYVAHHSVRTHIVGCTMDSINGDGVRIRDGSDEALIDSCTFVRTGHNAVCSMWYCEANIENCDQIHPECPSCLVVMRDCRAFGDRDCRTPRLFADLVQVYSRRCAPGCRIEERFRSENNFVSACPP